MTTAVFRGDAGRTNEVLAQLAGSGLETDSRQDVRRTLLDTFDGRLRRAGWELELVEGQRTELLLGGPEHRAVALVVRRAPRFSSDLPPGPFRSRLDAVIDCRALRSVVSFTAARTSLTRRNADGKALVTVTVDDRAHAPSLVEVQGLVGYERAAAKVKASLAQLGLEARNDTAFGVVASELGVDLSWEPPGPTISLDRNGPSGSAFAAVLANLAAAVDANWQGTVDDTDPEFLHDFRVAVRRTRVVLAEGAGVLDEGGRAWARNEFRWLAGITSRARDLDVLALEWSSYLSGLDPATGATLAPLRDHLTSRRRTAHDELASSLSAPRYASMMERWSQLLGELPAGAEVPIGRLVADRLVRAQRRLLGRGRVIGQDSPAAELHELRKDAKRLRYVLECFGGVLPASRRKLFVQRLKVLQDNLGEHQDAEVHAAELARMGAELHQSHSVEGPVLVVLGQVVERLQQRQRAARREFAVTFSRYDTKETARQLRELCRRAGR